MRVLELSLCEAFVVVDGAIADELHLRDTWDGLEIRVEDRLLCVTGLVIAMAIVLRAGVKGLSAWTSVKRGQVCAR